MKLKYQPISENASRFASDTVELSSSVLRVELDYSPSSLESVDGIIGQMRRDGVTVEEVGGSLFGFGAYVGEVFVRNAKALWVDFDEERIKNFGHPIGIQMPDGGLWNPIGKTFKRFFNGLEDSLPYFYWQIAGR